MSDQPANPDRALADLARRQHGVVSVKQLRTAGVDKHGVTYRVRVGRLHRVHRGVYAVGHPRLTFAGRCAAAVLACAPQAAISHLSAGVLWEMLSFNAGLIEITIATQNGRDRRRGIRIHRSPLGDNAVRRKDGIPVTSPLRTLEDLKRTRPDLHQPALRKALDLKLVTEAELGPDPDLTRSELERFLVRFARRRRLPRPLVNARVGPCEVDFLWPDVKVIVEADSYRHHGDRLAFERDRKRDAHLQELGYRVVRVTWRMIRDEPDAVRSSLIALLG